MKKLFTLIAALLLTATVWAQSGCPQRMSYQAVVRNAANELVTSTNGIQVTIKITDGTVTYIESHTVNSNQNGLISLMVGAGTVEEGTMDGMDWPNATFTTTVTVPGEASVEATTTVEAVPYALYACEINPNGVNITKIVTDINNHIEDTLNNYYTKNETDSKFETKAALCTDVITCVDNAIADGTSTTNLAIDTIVNNQIMKAAADSLISTRELTDSLKNYTETSKLCDYISDNCITEIGERMHTLNVINNSTITIKQGDSELGSFTLNQETPTTITIPTPDAQAQSDWAQTDETKADFIKNKPNIEKIVRDSLADGNSAINHVVDTIVNNQIMKAAADSLISTRELTDSLSNYKIQDCEDVITCVDNAIADGSSTTNNAIDTIVKNNVLTELQDGTSDINHTVDTIVNNNVLTELQDGASDINHTVDTIVKNNVLTELQDGTSDINHTVDTIVNNNVLTELQDGTSDINQTVDTIVNNQIMKAAADSLISARELTDSLKNYTETSKLCEYITTNCTNIALDSEIPTVNNSTITIKQGDTDLGTFTLNQSTGTTITIPSAAEQAQSDWAQTDDSKADYIKNKPNIEKIVRDSLVNGNSAINHVVDTIVNNNVLYELQDGTSDINHTVDTIVNNNVLTELQDGTSDINHTVDTIVKNNVLTELKDGTSNINHTVDTIVNNQIMKAAADSLISTRELTDSLSNYKIQDCEDVISCVNTAIADGTSTTNLAIDTIVKNIANNLIEKAAADSLISTRELTDSLKNYTETSKLCDYITTNCTDLALDSEISNKTITIKAADGTTTVGSFTLNQTTDATITLPASATVNNGKLTITDDDANTAEFTANQATNTTVKLGTVAFTNDYTDLTNTPTIPTVNDATVTIKNNGTTIGTFTLNASSAATVNILDRQYSEQYAATAGQTTFTATIPSGYTSINTDSRLIQLYINGVMVGTNLSGVVTVSGTTVTYVPSVNDGYELRANDRVEIIYWVK